MFSQLDYLIVLHANTLSRAKAYTHTPVHWHTIQMHSIQLIESDERETKNNNNKI
jgi:hypothetical protein